MVPGKSLINCLLGGGASGKKTYHAENVVNLKCFEYLGKSQFQVKGDPPWFQGNPDWCLMFGIDIFLYIYIHDIKEVDGCG